MLNTMGALDDGDYYVNLYGFFDTSPTISFVLSFLCAAACLAVMIYGIVKIIKSLISSFRLLKTTPKKPRIAEKHYASAKRIIK